MCLMSKKNKKKVKKYEEKELVVYAGKIAQSSLSSKRTVAAFNLKRKILARYKQNLTEVKKATSTKGLFIWIFSGSVEALFINRCLPSALSTRMYFVQNGCASHLLGHLHGNIRDFPEFRQSGYGKLIEALSDSHIDYHPNQSIRAQNIRVS